MASLGGVYPHFTDEETDAQGPAQGRTLDPNSERGQPEHVAPCLQKQAGS